MDLRRNLGICSFVWLVLELFAFPFARAVEAIPSPKYPTEIRKSAVGEEALSLEIGKAAMVGRVALQHDDYATAQQSLVAAVRLQPELSEVVQLANYAAINNGDLQAAHEMAEIALAQNPTIFLPLLTEIVYGANATTPRWKLEAAQKLPQTDIGILLTPLLQSWLKVGAGRADAMDGFDLTNSSGVLSLVAQHQLAMAEYAKDEKHLLQALEILMPKTDEAYGQLSLTMVRQLGGYFERQGRTQIARRLYQAEGEPKRLYSALAVDRQRLESGGPPPPVMTPQVGIALLLLESALLVNNGRKDDRLALSLLRIAEWLDPRNPEILMTRGELLGSWKLYDQALPAFEAMSQDSDPQWSWQGRIRYGLTLEQLERPEEAAALLKAMSEENPTDTQALQELANLDLRRKDYSQALSRFTQALKRAQGVKPENWSLIYGQAVSFERLGRRAEAIAGLKQALSLAPNEPELLNYLGFMWAERGENLDEALGLLQKAWQLKPDDGAITDSVGWVYYQQRAYDKAILLLERAVQLSAWEPEINEHLGDAYWQVGRLSEARVKWQMVLSLSPTQEMEQRVREKLVNGIELKPARGLTL
ncbi:MAG: tetratricopeptide repeat protein [Alphaproteobacteria bacterium]|nr:tetratricopeptide repeat protein [Alphaproteobacteria bacterium]